MDRYKKQVITGIIATAIVLLVLLSGQKIYERYYIDQPLFKIYKEIKAVEDVQVEDYKQEKKILVTIDPQANLKQIYSLVDEQTREVYGNKKYALAIQDKPSRLLENIMVDLEPYIYQGLATGQLVDMVTGIKTKSATAGVDAKVYMDNQRVYLVLRKGNNYLQEIIPRQEEIAPVSGEAKA